MTNATSVDIFATRVRPTWYAFPCVAWIWVLIAATSTFGQTASAAAPVSQGTPSIPLSEVRIQLNESSAQGPFDGIVQVIAANQSVCEARLISGNRKYFLLVGKSEGLSDVTVWFMEQPEPHRIRVRVVPASDQYAALVQKIKDSLGFDVRIEPIPLSNNVRISGTLQNYRQTQRVLEYIIGDTISRDRIVNELKPGLPPVIPCQQKCRILRWR